MGIEQYRPETRLHGVIISNEPMLPLQMPEPDPPPEHLLKPPEPRPQPVDDMRRLYGMAVGAIMASLAVIAWALWWLL